MKLAVSKELVETNEKVEGLIRFYKEKEIVRFALLDSPKVNFLHIELVLQRSSLQWVDEGKACCA